MATLIHNIVVAAPCACNHCRTATWIHICLRCHPNQRVQNGTIIDNSVVATTYDQEGNYAMVGGFNDHEREDRENEAEDDWNDDDETDHVHWCNECDSVTTWTQVVPAQVRINAYDDGSTNVSILDREMLNPDAGEWVCDDCGREIPRTTILNETAVGNMDIR